MWYVNIAKQLDDLGPKGREEVLRQLLDTLAQVTDHEKAFVEVLLQENVLTRPQMELIMKRESKYERNVAAYNKVIENGNGRVLIWALHLTQNHHVIREIQAKLENKQRSTSISSPMSLSPGPSSPAPPTTVFKGLQNLLADSPMSMAGSPGSPYQNSNQAPSPAMVNMGCQSPRSPHSPSSVHSNNGGPGGSPMRQNGPSSVGQHGNPTSVSSMGHAGHLSPSPLATSSPQSTNGTTLSMPATSITNQMPSMSVTSNQMQFQNFAAYPYSHVVQHGGGGGGGGGGQHQLPLTTVNQNDFNNVVSPASIGPSFAPSAAQFQQQNGQFFGGQNTQLQQQQQQQQGHPAMNGVNWAPPPHHHHPQAQSGSQGQPQNRPSGQPFALPPSPPFDDLFEDVPMTLANNSVACQACGRDFDICQILRDCLLSKDNSNNMSDELYMF